MQDKYTVHSELKLKSTTGKGACYISQSSDTLVLQVSLPPM